MCAYKVYHIGYTDNVLYISPGIYPYIKYHISTNKSTHTSQKGTTSTHINFCTIRSQFSRKQINPHCYSVQINFSTSIFAKCHRNFSVYGCNRCLNGYVLNTATHCNTVKNCHSCLNRYVHACIHLWVYVDACVRLWAHSSIQTYIHIWVSIHTCIHAKQPFQTNTYMHTCQTTIPNIANRGTSTYEHTNRQEHRNRQTNIHTDIITDRPSRIHTED